MGRLGGTGRDRGHDREAHEGDGGAEDGHWHQRNRIPGSLPADSRGR